MLAATLYSKKKNSPKRIPLTHCAKLSTILKSESFILSHFIKWKFELLQEGVEQESPI